jgi:hypothetical protein
MQKFLKAVALVVAMGLSGMAQSAVLTTDTTPVLDATNTFSYSLNSRPVAGSPDISNTYSFSLASISDLSWGFSSVGNISGLAGSFYDSSNALVGSFLGMAVGTYTFIVTGDFSDPPGGNANRAYSGFINVSAVPEMQTWAMLGAGLIMLVGYVGTLRRRNGVDRFDLNA